MEKIRDCSICGKPTENGVYNVKQNFVCRSCLATYSNFYVDDFRVENGELFTTDPFAGMVEEDQRAACIQYAYTLFDQKLAKRSYSMFTNYHKKGYTWLGMIRALEWFYIVRKNDLSKANNSIGIIPHVYDDAQKYYKRANEIIRERYEKQIVRKEETQSRVVAVNRKKKTSGMDVGGL